MRPSAARRRASAAALPVARRRGGEERLPNARSQGRSAERVCSWPVRARARNAGCAEGPERGAGPFSDSEETRGAVLTTTATVQPVLLPDKFDTGERVLISIAGTPSPRASRSYFGGQSGIQPLNGRRIRRLRQKIDEDLPPRARAGPVHPLDVIRDTLLPCTSIDEARRKLLECEARADPDHWPGALHWSA
jgi:hypothetical protein